MKTKFFVRNGASKLTINFEFRDGVNVRFRVSTGLAISRQSDWDNKRGRMKLPSSTFNASLINSKINEFEILMNNHLLYNDNTINLEDVKKIFVTVFYQDQVKITKQNSTSKLTQNKIFREMPKTKIKEDNSFIAYYEWFLDFYSKNNSPYSKKVLSAGTIKTLGSALSVLKRYIESRNIEDIFYDDINRNFYHDFISFLNENKFSKNYTGTVIQKIKTVMGYSFDEGKHSNAEYKSKYFSKVYEVINHPYLNLSELENITQLELTDKKMDLARDIFLIACYTALRIGDLLKQIKNPTIVLKDNRKYIQIKQSKTSNVVYIPLNSKVSHIMKKYGDKLPNYLHVNKINKHIKSIAKRAKITENYNYTRTEGGVEVIYNVPKYKCITMHTARRSFCTNAYNEGMPVHDIMAISGHKSERVFLNYIKVDLLQNASRISNHHFFN